jgi:hypothetical protein
VFLFNYQYEIQDGHEERSFLRSRGNLLYRALKSSLIGRSCPNSDDIIYMYVKKNITIIASRK